MQSKYKCGEKLISTHINAHHLDLDLDYARSSPSIMPGQTGRDTGHKGLMPGVNCAIQPNALRPHWPRTLTMDLFFVDTAAVERGC